MLISIKNFSLGKLLSCFCLGCRFDCSIRRWEADTCAVIFSVDNRAAKCRRVWRYEKAFYGETLRQCATVFHKFGSKCCGARGLNAKSTLFGWSGTTSLTRHLLPNTSSWYLMRLEMFYKPIMRTKFPCFAALFWCHGKLFPSWSPRPRIDDKVFHVQSGKTFSNWHFLFC